MKKAVLAVLVVLCSISAFAGDLHESFFDLKAGIGYYNVGNYSPESAALDSSFAFTLGLDKFFSLGFETGLLWTRWDAYDPGAVKSGLQPGDKKKNSDVLCLPLMANAVVHYDLREKYHVMPYISAGAGYSWAFLLQPDERANYGGFTFEVLAGTSIRPKKNYYAEILVEAGYRGSSLSSREAYKLDLSGFVFRTGVRFSLGSLDKIGPVPETSAELTSPQ
ncbi:MAG TPA: outer membrane beta-barrel protein [Spirochaetota bacterium]|nr:outer membrane beta-barrel protein [Spirochaetota bacterium]HPI89641.1 outer membrane beta-barrel protein [Spirochaetota bacterium]HPR49220.1 outer membrane beta-barrel protein [Spirochaetota bacterium]